MSVMTSSTMLSRPESVSLERWFGWKEGEVEVVAGATVGEGVGEGEVGGVEEYDSNLLFSSCTLCLEPTLTGCLVEEGGGCAEEGECRVGEGGACVEGGGYLKVEGEAGDARGEAWAGRVTGGGVCHVGEGERCVGERLCLEGEDGPCVESVCLVGEGGACVEGSVCLVGESGACAEDE